MLPDVIEGIVFDCDGVLFDSEALHMRAWQDVLRGYGHEYPLHFFNAWIGKPCSEQAKVYEDMLEPKRPWQTYLDGKTRRFHELIVSHLCPFDGVPECLDALGARLPIAFATSTTRRDMDDMLARTDLGRRFAAGVMFEDVTHRKPHPEPYLKAAQLLNANPARCIALDDSPTGIASARDAGMCVFGIASSFGADVLKDAHRVFATTVEACACILDAIGQRASCC